MAAVYNYDTRALNPTLHIDVAQMGKRNDVKSKGCFFIPTFFIWYRLYM